MKQLTLLEWLNELETNKIETLSGLDISHTYALMSDLKNYGLMAFQRLPADRQLSILKMYVNSVEPHT